MTSLAKQLPARSSVLLKNGDRMKQIEFHQAYKLMPDGYRAELIGGVVFEPSPLGYPHGTSHVRLSYLFESYVLATPGVEAADNVTVILSEKDEVQPDLILRLGNQRGQSRIQDYVEGAPELVAEVAHSSRAIDLHLKKRRYRRAGVLEYVVVVLEPKEVHWFDMKDNIRLNKDADGIIRSAIFPGLWIHCQGLLELNHEQTSAALNAGIQSPEHKQFLKKLRNINH